jgi:hypothetical protein
MNKIAHQIVAKAEFLLKVGRLFRRFNKYQLISVMKTMSKFNQLSPSLVHDNLD